MQANHAPTLPKNPRRRDPLRLRAELPALAQPTRAHVPSYAMHDFLVPNPRPDLTLGAHTLRMIEAG